MCLLDLPNDIQETVDESGWDSGYPSSVQDTYRSRSPDPFDTSSVFQPDWSSEKPFEPPDWPVSHDPVLPSVDFEPNPTPFQQLEELPHQSKSENTLQAGHNSFVSPSPPPSLPVKQRKAEYEKLANQDQGNFMSELQNVLSKRGDIPKLAPPIGKSLSFRNKWESKDTNVRTEKGQSAAYGNLDPYAPQPVEAKNEELNQKNLELINRIAKMKPSLDTQSVGYSRLSPVPFNQHNDYNNLTDLHKPHFGSTRSINDNRYDKYAVFSEYQNVAATSSNQAAYSNTPMLANTSCTSNTYSSRNSFYSSTSITSNYNNIESGAYGNSSKSFNAEDDLSEQIGQMWLSSQSLSKDTIKMHNQLVAECKKKARNFYDPVEANYQRINYGSANLQEEDAVRELMRAVEGALEEECRAALQNSSWDLQAALKHIKLQRLLRLEIASNEQCRAELEKCNWDVVVAASRLLDRDKT